MQMRLNLVWFILRMQDVECFQLWHKEKKIVSAKTTTKLSEQRNIKSFEVVQMFNVQIRNEFCGVSGNYCD